MSTADPGLNLLIQEAVTIKPGQTLILRFSAHLTPHQLDEIRSKVQAKLPGIELLILGGSIEQVWVYDPEGSST